MPRREVTAHAAHRYIERVNQEASFDEAMRHLTYVFSHARRSKERTRTGDVYYHTEHLRLVVREEPRVDTVLTGARLP